MEKFTELHDERTIFRKLLPTILISNNSVQKTQSLKFRVTLLIFLGTQHVVEKKNLKLKTQYSSIIFITHNFVLSVHWTCRNKSSTFYTSYILFHNLTFNLFY